ncbi:hypothetical protein CJF42_24445 [Pseudoalteromonas sp. NBT06-2]|uniref:ABC transporter ATP-binding protein n=1 Tax=Pseudoalteromonas sp. NBT06-2 TaxID=2025950 RepID=UPI000BA70D66|nr:ABC transporter ATP-binding protein [Pseudoalteromonas sp. NBT06-2]PAJ71854.1 hypothetical protein CJF42_24445 [Pseudoalteromonas sp. NBT06-2]
MKSLEISNVSYSYDKTKAIENINLSFLEGDISILLGPNGAGKTTLIKLISNLLSGYSGEVYLSDSKRKSEIKNCDIGLLFEGNRSLFHKLTPIENLIYFGVLKGLSHKKAKERANKYLIEVGLKDKLNEPIGKLSRGMQQKVSFGASIIHEPTILILDEPSLGMDFLGVDFLIEYLKEYAKKAIILLATHDLKIAQSLGKKAILINNGKVKSKVNLSMYDSQSSTVIVKYFCKTLNEIKEEECDKENLISFMGNIDITQIKSVNEKDFDLETLLRRVI